MDIKTGWIFLIVGLFGLIAVLRARTFSVTTESAHGKTATSEKKQIVVTPMRRLIGVVLSLAVLGYGVARIQMDNAWNPFEKTSTTVTPQ